jgi:hypothetical protein
LGTVVGITEDRGQDGKGGGVGEDGAEGDSRWLYGREVWKRPLSVHLFDIFAGRRNGDERSSRSG